MKCYITLCFFACIAGAHANDLTTVVKGTLKGSTTGSIDLSINGGASPYQISWSGPNGFNAKTEDLTNLGVGAYTVTVTDNYCGSATATVIVTDYLTAIDELNEEQISIFPNPTGASVEIQLPEFFKNYQFRIVNALGGIVMEKKNISVSSFTIDLENMNAGMYFMEIIKDDRLYRKKVMKY
jgi:hypothetical protein